MEGTVETFYRASGNGGQHRNKTDSAVRLQHPSGIVVTSERQRHQWQNRQVAWAELKRRLSERDTTQAHTERNDARVRQFANRNFTWTEWRDEVVGPSGKRARYSDLIRGRNFEKMI